MTLDPLLFHLILLDYGKQNRPNKTQLYHLPCGRAEVVEVIPRQETLEDLFVREAIGGGQGESLRSAAL